jgi:hypothetical protein
VGEYSGADWGSGSSRVALLLRGLFIGTFFLFWDKGLEWYILWLRLLELGGRRGAMLNAKIDCATVMRFTYRRLKVG